MNAGCRLVPVLLFTALAATATAAERPPLLNLRYEENAKAYSGLQADHVTGPLKYIALGSSETSYLSLGGQARVRWENWEGFGFNDANEDDFGLYRLRLHADLHLGERVRLFVEGKSALSTYRDLPGGRRTLDVDAADLQNAFLDLVQPLGDWTATLRLGRQELEFGKQRLVSPLDWANTRRTFDGARAILKNGAWRIDAFASELVQVEKYDFNEPDEDTHFHGLYATHAVPDLRLAYDVYFLELERDGLPAGEERRHTVGSRVGGSVADFDYDVEGGGQFGERDDDDICAWFAAAEVGYTLKQAAGQPRLYLGADYASGDDDPTDGDLKTFDQLFPLGHAYFGFIDFVGRQNVVDFSQGVAFWPIAKKAQVKIDHHVFQRAEREDALYNAGGGVVRAGDAGDSREIGSELDLTLMLKINRETTAWLGYSRFFAGRFIEQSGPSDDIDFAYASVQYTF